MSLLYDDYLAEHIGNVNKGLHWMLDNLELNNDEKNALENAITTFNHDASKYDREEYLPYDEYFYGGNRSYQVVQDFNYAWLRHIHHNPHHWQYWVLLEDDPQTGDRFKALAMPLYYIFEMIADWWSFSWKNENLGEIFTWYDSHRDKMILHRDTRRIVEDILRRIREKVGVPEEEVKFVDAALSDDGSLIIEHSGVKGQKWGVRNGPPYPLNPERDYSDTENRKMGLDNVKKSKNANLDKWGSDEDHNVLYVAGITGSGKSTVALGLKKDGDQVIHLDAYSEPGDDMDDIRNKEFDKYLKKKIPDFESVRNSAEDGSTEIKRYSPEYMKKIDEFNNAINDFSKAQYSKGNRVIVEGVQIADEWLADKNSYKDKPVVVLQTGPIKSVKRAFDRDGRGGLIKGLAGLDDAKDYISWIKKSVDNLDSLADTVGAKKNNYNFDLLDNELHHSDDEEDPHQYGVPEQKKFPLPDKDHVLSAIRFFNYVDPKYEKELAKAILEKIEEYGVTLGEDITVGEENKFKKYITEKE